MKLRHYAYLAGMMDGDGCFAASKSWQKRSNCFQYSFVMSLVTKQKTTVARLIELFGGTCNKQRVDGTLYWNWVCTVRKNQRDVLEGILPFLVLKKRQAELGLEFVNLGHAMVPDLRAALVEQIQALNRQVTNNSEIDIPAPSGKLACAYIAGLIDAEGTLSIVKAGTSTRPYIAIYNDSTRLMKWLELATGISGGLHKKPNHYAWFFWGKNKERERFLLSVLPYLVTKRKQAIVLLEYTRMFKKKDPALRAALLDEMYALNHQRTSETQVPNTSSEVKTEPELVRNHESELAKMQVS